MQLPDFSNTEIAFRNRSQPELWRAFGLFRLINYPLLVKSGGPLMTAGFKLHLPLSPLVRWTVFRQFCGGETLKECRATIDQMAKEGVHAILDYGVEGEKTERGFDAATDEILRTADEAGKNANIPFVVFKLTAIARMGLLEKLDVSGEAKLSTDEKSEWRRVRARVEKICDAAALNRKPVMIDAEESWIQKTIDAVAEEQMRKRNRNGHAMVYNTIQMYRIDRLDYLKHLSALSHKEGWQLGLKIVRGAYMEKERERALRENRPSPIQPDKSATDRAYDTAVQFCLQHQDHIWICVGTHNEASCVSAAKQLLESSDHIVTKDSPRHVWFSQLLGMSDHLTYNLANAGFNVAKYVPYGPVQAVLPYLIRRAQENTSVAGQSSRELQLIEKELKRRRHQL